MPTISMLLTGRAGEKATSSGVSAALRDNLASLLGLVLLSAVVSAVVAAVAVGFAGSGGEPFGLEWIALWVAALATIVLTGRAAFALAGFVVPMLSRTIDRRRRAREDQCFLRSARLDARLMADIDGAMRRSEWS